MCSTGWGLPSLDLNMLAMTEGGSERTEKEFAGLFESAILGTEIKALGLV